MMQQRLHFDAVVTPSGSGLTHAGLLTVLRALGQSMPVHGICVRRDADEIEIMISDAVLGAS